MIPEKILNDAILISRCMGCSYWWLKTKGGSRGKVMKRSILAYLLRTYCTEVVSMRMLSSVFGRSERVGHYYYTLAKAKLSDRDPDFTDLYLKGKENFLNPDKSQLPDFIDTSRFQRTVPLP